MNGLKQARTNSRLYKLATKINNYTQNKNDSPCAHAKILQTCRASNYSLLTKLKSTIPMSSYKTPNLEVHQVLIPGKVLNYNELSKNELKQINKLKQFIHEFGEF